MNENYEERMSKALEKVPEARASYFQLKYFTIGQQVTIQAQMWQCLKELQLRKKTTDSAKMQIEEFNDDLDLLNIKREELELNIEGKDIIQENLEKKKRIIFGRKLERQRKSIFNSIKELEDKIKYTEQESRYFLTCFEELNKIEPLKDFDDFETQKEYWNEKISEKIQLKLLLQQPIDLDLIETALALPDDTEVKIQINKILNTIVNQSKQLEIGE